jgi:hypothetical protein
VQCDAIRCEPERRLPLLVLLPPPSLSRSLSNARRFFTTESFSALAAVDPAAPVDVMPDLTQSARRIVEIMCEAAHPIGHLIQEIDAEKFGSRLAFLLMAGMTGIFTATNAIDDQLAEIVEPTKSTARGANT